MMGAPAQEFSDAELGAAWVVALEAAMVERDTVTKEILAAQEEVAISPDDRASKLHLLHLKKTRIDDDLIALGQVLEICRRQAVEEKT